MKDKVLSTFEVSAFKNNNYKLNAVMPIHQYSYIRLMFLAERSTACKWECNIVI